MSDRDQLVALSRTTKVIFVEDASPPPTTIIGQGFLPGPLPLGLDRPLNLRGGDRLAPDRLPCELPLDWLPELVSVVAETCREQVLAERSWLTMPPVLLSGQTGCGRTHVARTIARHAGLPFVSIDVAGRPGAERMGGTGATTFDAPLPPRPVLAMAATGCANPVILLTGLDDATEETLGQIEAMIDPATASGFVDQHMRATIDLGHVNWILQSGTGHRLPPALARTVRSIPMRLFYRDPERELLILSVLAEAVEDLRLRPEIGGFNAAWIASRMSGDHRYQRHAAEWYRTAVELLCPHRRS